jgi:hypothetical protein
MSFGFPDVAEAAVDTSLLFAELPEALLKFLSLMVGVGRFPLFVFAKYSSR